MAGVQTVVVEPDTGFQLTVVDLDPLRAAICAVGEFDLAARDDLAEVLRQQEVARRHLVRLDMSKVTLLDCSCLSVLVASHRRFIERRGVLVLTGLDARVARIVRIAGLEDCLFLLPADQETFGTFVMTRDTRRRRILEQRLAATVTSVDMLEEVSEFADEFAPSDDSAPEPAPEPESEPEPPAMDPADDRLVGASTVRETVS